MTLNDYQIKALATDTFDQKANQDNVGAAGFIEKVLGLVGESGEFADKIKKIIRDKDGIVDEATKKELIKELGDVLWYIATLSQYLGSDLEMVGQTNIDKLTDRQARGVIQSQGDNR